MAQQRKGMCAGGNTEVDTYWSRSREHGTAEKGYVCWREPLRWIRIGIDQESMAQQRKGMCAGGNTEVDTYGSRSREHGTAEKGYVCWREH